MSRAPLLHPLTSRVRQTIQRHQMISPEDRIGVAVSGGIDSVALLDILHGLREELDISLMVLHLNHGIRGEEAESDQQFVHDLSTEYNLPFVTKTVDVLHYMEEASLSLQEAARQLRYRFFEEAMRDHGLYKVAVGQTADDQAETVLMRFIRGGGAQGLKGIPYIRDGRYIRPLLECWREEIQGYIHDHGITFVQDSSNLSTIYLRNRIRHELLPYLSSYNPTIKERLLRLAHIMGEDDHSLGILAHEVADEIITKDTGMVSLSIPRFLSLTQALKPRILQLAFWHVCPGMVLEYPHVQSIMEIAHQGTGSKRISLPGGVQALLEYDTLILRRAQKIIDRQLKETLLHIPGQTTLKELRIAIDATVHEGRASHCSNPQEAYLDYDRLTLPLRIRSYRPGDRFTPLGMQGNKKVKDFFIDHKIPRDQRKEIPLVTTEEDICWVAGYRIDDRFKIRDTTLTTLKLALVQL